MHGRSDKARRVEAPPLSVHAQFNMRAHLKIELVQGLRNIVVHPDHGFRAGAEEKTRLSVLGGTEAGPTAMPIFQNVSASEADTKMSERVTPHARVYFAAKPTVVSFAGAARSATIGRGVKTLT
jgi:hypothetical protein